MESGPEENCKICGGAHSTGQCIEDAKKSERFENVPGNTIDKNISDALKLVDSYIASGKEIDTQWETEYRDIVGELESVSAKLAGLVNKIPK